MKTKMQGTGRGQMIGAKSMLLMTNVPEFCQIIDPKRPYWSCPYRAHLFFHHKGWLCSDHAAEEYERQTHQGEPLG